MLHANRIANKSQFEQRREYCETLVEAEMAIENEVAKRSNSAEKVAKACKGMESLKALTLTQDEVRGVEISALQSIAISLKRIADSLQKPRVEVQPYDFSVKNPGGFFE